MNAQNIIDLAQPDVEDPMLEVAHLLTMAELQLNKQLELLDDMSELNKFKQDELTKTLIFPINL